MPKRDVWRHGGELDEILDMRGVPLTWDTLEEIRSWAPLPLVLKGILAADDARDFATDATPEQVRATLERLGLDAHGEPVVA